MKSIQEKLDALIVDEQEITCVSQPPSHLEKLEDMLLSLFIVFAFLLVLGPLVMFAAIPESSAYHSERTQTSDEGDK